MSTRKPRPVITVVDARPMSEIGFRSNQPPASTPGKVAHQDVQPANTGKSHTIERSGHVAQQPTTNTRPAPVKAFHNIPTSETVSSSHQINAPAKEAQRSPHHQTSPVSDARVSETIVPQARPRPKPRPRSMIVPPPNTSLLDEDHQTEHLPQPLRPSVAGRPTVGVVPEKPMSHSAEGADLSKSLHRRSSGSGLVASRSAEFDKPSAADKPPMVKPKPKPQLTTQINNGSLDKDHESGRLSQDNGRRKPTIIHPSAVGTSTTSHGVENPVPTLPKPSTQNRPSTNLGTSQSGANSQNSSASWYTDKTSAERTAPDQFTQKIPPQRIEGRKTSQPTIIRRRSSATFYTDESTAEKVTDEHNVQKIPGEQVEMRKTAQPVAVSRRSAASWYGADGMVVEKSSQSELQQKTTTMDKENPQPKKRPTIIRMGRASANDVTGAVRDDDESQKQRPQTDDNLSPKRGDVISIQAHETKPHRASSPTAEVENVKNHTLEASIGSVAHNEHKTHAVAPVPRPRPQPAETKAEKVVKKSAPLKPPPPKLEKTKVEEASIQDQTIAADANATGRPPRPASQPNRPPTKPSAPSTSHHGLPPSLPQRPTLGHPLYHYVVKGPHALALFDYTALQPDELSFSAGEIIELQKQVNAEWMIGSTGHGSGMFPINFVEVVEPLPPGDDSTTASGRQHSKAPEKAAVEHGTKSSPSHVTGPHCIARFDYEAGEPGDLDFVCGDVIRLLERVSDEWLRGELNGRSGVFPLAFVEIIEDLPSTSANVVEVAARVPDASPTRDLPSTWSHEHELHGPVNDGQPYCIATFDFTGETPEDLSFRSGDRITLLAHINAEWLRGSVHGQEGIFPAAFVNIVCDIKDELPPRPKVASVPSSPRRLSVNLTPTDRSEVPRLESEPIVESATGLRAVALFDFDGDVAQGDLCFHAGETIEDVRNLSPEWMSGRIGNRSGTFPTAFVEIS